MSVHINAYVSAEMPAEGTPLARVNEGGVWLWPQGVGVGSVIVCSEAEYDRMHASVMQARAAYRGLQGYAACEGNGDEL